MVPPSLKALTTAYSGQATTEASARFLLDVWDCHKEGYTFLGTRRSGDDRWVNHPISGNREAAILKVLAVHPVEKFDIYFAPNAFSEPRNLADYALQTRYAWNDIDNANPANFEPQPSILWETSPGRFQGLWRWNRLSEGRTAAQYSRNLWRAYGGDKGGWSVSKMLRLPGGMNHKANYKRPPIRLIKFDPKPQRMPLGLSLVSMDDHATSGAVNQFAHKPSDVLMTYRRAIGCEVSQLINSKKPLRADRSKRVFQIIAALVDAGASNNEIASVLWVNVYFLAKCGESQHLLESEIARVRSRVEVAR